MKVVVNKEIVKKTNQIWGPDEVTDCAMEEFAEAIQAVSKVRRFPKDKRTYENLNDEIADVLIAIEALEDLNLIDAESVQQFIDFKQNRQKARNNRKEMLMAAKAGK
ncbi:MAG: hypothetical protein Q4C49_05560 [Bacillota bacterium]|nr:hypothetical protein [Bacillota bacterium]